MIYCTSTALVIHNRSGRDDENLPSIWLARLPVDKILMKNCHESIKGPLKLLTQGFFNELSKGVQILVADLTEALVSELSCLETELSPWPSRLWIDASLGMLFMGSTRQNDHLDQPKYSIILILAIRAR